MPSTEMVFFTPSRRASTLAAVMTVSLSIRDLTFSSLNDADDGIADDDAEEEHILYCPS